jgi:hypothetical protein
MKRLARERNTTVSSLFEDWGSRVLLEEPETRPLGDLLQGNWDTSKAAEEGDARLDYLLNKHG